MTRVTTTPRVARPFRTIILAALLAATDPAGLVGAEDPGVPVTTAVADRDPAVTPATDSGERRAIQLAEAGTEGPGRAKSEREQTRAQLVTEVTQAWQRPRIVQQPSTDINASAALAPIQRKLDAIVLDHVHWTRVPVREVVASLSAASEQFDPSSDGLRGLNVVLLDPANANPLVTLTLRRATLRRVLDFVTEAVGYQYEVQADAIVVRPGGETSKLDTAFFPVARATAIRMTGMAAPAQVSVASSPRDGSPAIGGESSAPGAEAAGMRSFLQQAGVSFAIEGSSLAYDGSAIIVTQTARNLERIRNILARYREVRQVEIESKFMEVQEGALEELGVQWGVTRRGLPRVDPVTGEPVRDAHGRQVFVPQEVYTTAGVNRSLAGAFGSSQGGGSISITGNDNLQVPFHAPQLPGAISVGTSASPVASVTGMVGEFDVNAVIRALAQKEGTDLLSAPKVTVLSGNPATITVAQEMRYPQSYGEIQSQVGTGSASGGGSAGVAITAGTPQEFTSRNVGVELKVTPTVEEDDHSISLDLNPRVTEFDGFVEYGGPSVAISGGTTVTVPAGFFQPIFSVRDISTKVTIWDGATLVMGGLTREEVKKVDDKVPVLGSIPLLGRLFRSQGESSQKRNLLIFVTANLVSPGGTPRRQNLPAAPGNAMFQNPTLVTPAGSAEREPAHP